MSGREMLERLKAEHRQNDGFCDSCLTYDSVACEYEPISWPCGYVGLIAALEEALAGHDGFAYTCDHDDPCSCERQILAKLGERSE